MALEERAQKVQSELFSRYDQLNDLWNKAEKELTKFHIPRAVQCDYGSVTVDEHKPNEWSFVVCLGLQKIKGSWRICHGTYQEPDEPNDWTPIIECSAEIRVEAAEHLPKLRKKVIESAERFLPKVDKAIGALSAALNSDNGLDALLAERAKLNGKS